MSQVEQAEQTISNLGALFAAIKATGVTSEQYRDILQALYEYDKKEAQS